MRYFKDFEFHENGTTIIPISLGMVCRRGSEIHELYIEFKFDERAVRAQNPWVAENVLPKLTLSPSQRIDFETARIQIYNFMGTDTDPQFWGYYADYDWVAFCRLWGKMIDLPSHFPMFCMDLQQLFVHLGSPEGVKPAQDEEQHNALVDARWNLSLFDVLQPIAEAKGLVL